MSSKRIYQYDGVAYEATITFRRSKSLTLRLGDNKSIRVGAPYYTPYSVIDKFVQQNLPKLLKRVNSREKDVKDEQYYLFGQPQERYGLSEDEIKQYIKRELLSYVTERTMYYEALMNIHPPYKVLVRDMSTRYGVNSKATQRITYALSLAYYSREIIDCIIVHELAHHFQRNHQKAFYDVVYRYCPNYDELHEKLRKRIHA